jgi:hypothetical protein
MTSKEEYLAEVKKMAVFGLLDEQTRQLILDAKAEQWASNLNTLKMAEGDFRSTAKEAADDLKDTVKKFDSYYKNQKNKSIKKVVNEEKDKDMKNAEQIIKSI